MKALGRISAFGAFLLLFVCAALWPAGAQQVRPHAEACSHPGWGYLRAIDNRFGTVNACSYPIDIWFLTTSAGQLVHQTVPPAGIFDTGQKLGVFDWRRGWTAATCRAGYEPSVPVTIATEPQITASRYSCKLR
jgi:hypothetical protein